MRRYLPTEVHERCECHECTRARRYNPNIGDYAHCYERALAQQAFQASNTKYWIVERELLDRIKRCRCRLPILYRLFELNISGIEQARKVSEAELLKGKGFAKAALRELLDAIAPKK